MGLIDLLSSQWEREVSHWLDFLFYALSICK